MTMKCKFSKDFPFKTISIILIFFAILSAAFSYGGAGLTALLEVLRRLFEEGKISEDLYNKLRKAAIKKFQENF
jgi:hypothetical protein